MLGEQTVETIEDDQRGPVSEEEINEWLQVAMDRSEQVAKEQCDFFEKVTNDEYFW